MNILVVRLEPGDDLRGALEQLALPAACVVSGIGSLTRAVLRYAAQDEGTVLEGPLEVISLAGTLSVDGAHLHASVADAKGQLRGGHVMRGCTIRTTAEIVLCVLDGVELRRKLDVRTGFKELVGQAKAALDAGSSPA